MLVPIVTLWVLLVAIASANGSVDRMREAGAEAQYQFALTSIESKDYADALKTLRRLQVQYPAYSRMAAVQTRIAVLQEARDAGDALSVFLSALDLRDAGKTSDAMNALDWIASEHPVSVLADDALYVTAYLLVMDRYDFAMARTVLAELRTRFADSAYRDSADYLDAIALEQLGDTERARDALVELRDRHTALSLPLNFRWPVGSVLSRYWFDRADRRLAIVEKRMRSSSSLTNRDRADDGQLRIGVNVEGADMQLLLSPSPLTRNTAWHDGSLGDALPPAIGVYHGTVEGMSNTWVRAVLADNSITGVIDIDGRQLRLQPGHLIGTLDYYQPRFRRGKRQVVSDSALAENLAGIDVLVAPPEESSSDLGRRSRSIQTDVRAVPVSIVIDSQFDRYYAGAGLSTALNNLNIADGIYRKFGIALTLDEAITFDGNNDPMNLGPVTLENILRSFRDYRQDYSTLFQDSALTYLFSGNPKTDVTLGLAWIDTACRLDGYDVGVTTPTGFGDVLLTHELGHSLGSQHDSDTSCNTNSRSLMWPNISSQTEPVFTSCSQESVLRSRTKSCLLNSVDLSLTAHASGNTLNFEAANPDGALTLDAKLLLETGNPDQLIWPAGCQALSPTSATCFLDTLGPMETRTLSFSVSSHNLETSAPVTAQLLPVNTMELSPADNTATTSLAGGSSEHLPISAGAQTGGSTTGDSNENQSVIADSGGSSGGGATGLFSLLLLSGLLGGRFGRLFGRNRYLRC